MTNQSKLRRSVSTKLVVPAIVALAVLVLFNMGLYRRLGTASASNQDMATPPAQPTPKVADPTPAAEGIRYSSEFTGTLADSGWKAFAGDWVFQDGHLLQRQIEGFDLGIVYSQSVQNFRYVTNFRLDQGLSAGVFFNLPQIDSKNGGHMVRYSDDGTGVFWGYFDGQGVFNGQGFAGTGTPGNGLHILEIQSAANTYSIALDGTLLGENIPLQSTQGYVGLTTSQSAATFEQVEILDLGTATGTAEQTAEATANLLANSTAISGEWVREANGIRQNLTEATDYFTGIGVLAEEYVVEVDVNLPTEFPDSGGGLLFHAPERDALPGAYMVRFGEGGKILFWGHYDAQGIFQGQGSVETNLKAGEAHHLTLIVRKGTFDVLVDSNPIIGDLPLDQPSGWIGLISYRGPVVFSNLRLMLGGSTA
jgi:hypothetical protein